MLDHIRETNCLQKLSLHAHFLHTHFVSANTSPDSKDEDLEDSKDKFTHPRVNWICLKLLFSSLILTSCWYLRILLTANKTQLNFCPNHKVCIIFHTSDPKIGRK